MLGLAAGPGVQLQKERKKKRGGEPKALPEWQRAKNTLAKWAPGAGCTKMPLFSIFIKISNGSGLENDQEAEDSYRLRMPHTSVLEARWILVGQELISETLLLSVVPLCFPGFQSYGGRSSGLKMGMMHGSAYCKSSEMNGH